MQRVERSARIGAPPETLFAFLSDLDNLPAWQSGIVSAEVTSGGEVGIGSTASIVRDLMGQRIEAPLTVTAFDPPRRLGIGSEVSGVGVDAELILDPGDDGSTDLRFAMEIRAGGFARFMEPMIAGAAGGEIDASIGRLQERFGSGS